GPPSSAPSTPSPCRTPPTTARVSLLSGVARLTRRRGWRPVQVSPEPRNHGFEVAEDVGLGEHLSRMVHEQDLSSRPQQLQLLGTADGPGPALLIALPEGGHHGRQIRARPGAVE